MIYESQYSDAVLRNMQSAYGKGFLSPGGAAEVTDMVAGVKLRDRTVLDLGCGVGGASFLLAEQHGARSVVGVDLEEAVIAEAAAEAIARGLAERVRFLAVKPGALPTPDEAFDIVFSKDVICHVPDKASLFCDLFRVLRPGGMLVFGDFLKGADGAAANAFATWWTCIAASGLKFHFEEQEVYRDGLAAAGFVSIDMRDHNPWSVEVTRQQLERLTGPHRQELERSLGPEGLATRIAQTRTRLLALESRGLLHCHLRARKPA